MANPYAGQAADGFNQGGGAAASRGYQGLAPLMAMLQGGVSQDQYNNMLAGANGTHKFGTIGGMHGAAQGISPWAISYLMQHLMTKNPAAQQALTGPDGQPLTGSALQMAQLENSLSAGAPATYSMGHDVTSDQLAHLLGTYSTDTGHNAYMHGATAQGIVPAGHVPDRTYRGGNGGFPPGVFGYGMKGHPFHSRLAAIAAGRLGKGGPGGQHR